MSYERGTTFAQADIAIDAWESSDDRDEAVEEVISAYEEAGPDVQDYIVKHVGNWVRG